MAYKYRFPTSTGREITFEYPEMLSRAEAQDLAEQYAQDQVAEEQRIQAEAFAERQRVADEYGGFSGLLEPEFYSQDLPMALAQAGSQIRKSGGDILTALGATETGRELSESAAANIQAFEQLKSDPYQALQAMNAAELAQQEGALDRYLTSAEHLLANPTLGSQAFIQSAPALAATGAVGRGATVLGAAPKLASGTAMVTGAALQSADVVGDVYQTVYDAEIANGASQDEAVSAALANARSKAAAMFGVSMATMMLPGGSTLEKVLAGTNTGRGLVAGAIKGFLGEAAQESIEEGTAKALKNLAAQEYDPTVDLGAGVAEAAGAGAALGGPLGGIGGGASGAYNAGVAAEEERQKRLRQVAEREAEAAKAEAEAAKAEVEAAGAAEVGEAPDEAAGDGWFPGVTDPQLRMDAIDRELDAIAKGVAGYDALDPKVLNEVKRSLSSERKLAVKARQKLRAEEAKRRKEDEAALEMLPKRAEESAAAFEQEGVQEDLFGVVPEETRAQPPQEFPLPPVADRTQAQPDVRPLEREELKSMGLPLEGGYTQNEFLKDAGLEAGAELPAATTKKEAQRKAKMRIGRPTRDGKMLSLGPTFEQTRDALVGLDLTTEEGVVAARKVLDGLDVATAARARGGDQWITDLRNSLSPRLAVVEQQIAEQKAEENARLEEVLAQQVAQDEETAEQEAFDAETREGIAQQVDAQEEAQKAAEMEQAFADLRERNQTDTATATEEDLRDLEASGFELEPIDVQAYEQAVEQSKEFGGEVNIDDYIPSSTDPETRAAADKMAKQYLATRYVDLNSAKNQEAMADLEATARDLLGDRTWAAVKGAITKRQNQQIRDLREQRLSGPKRGETADMFAAQERADLQAAQRGAAAAQARAETVKAREEKQAKEAQEAEIKAYDDAFAKATKRSKKSKGAAKVMNGEYVYRGHHIQKSEDGAWNVGEAKNGKPVTEFSDAASSLTEAKAIVDNYIEPEVVEDAERPTIREAEVRGRVRGDDNLRGSERSVEVAKPARAAKPKAAKAPTPPKPRRVDDTPRTTGGDAGRAGGEQAPLALPEGAAIVQKAITDPSKDNVADLLDMAEKAGYMSTPQAIRYTIKANDPVERARAVNHVARAMADTAYFQNNPEQAAEMSRQVATLMGATKVERRVEKAKADTFDPDKEAAEIRALEDEGYIDDFDIFDASRTPFASAAPAAQVSELEKEFSTLISRVRKHNKVNVVQSTSDLPFDAPKDIRGAYHAGEVYVVADNTHAAQFEEVVAHELVGHLGLESMLGKGGFRALLQTVHKLKDSNPEIRRVLENIKAAYTDPQGQYNLDETQEAREILAHIAQSKASYLTDSRVMRAYNAVVNKVKQFLGNLGFGDQGSLLLDQLVYDAALHVEGGKHANRGGRYFLRSPSAAQMLMQRAWDMGYRGYDVNSAGAYMRNLPSTTVTPELSQDMLSEDFNEEPLNQVAFSRAPIDPDVVDPRFRKFIKEPAAPQGKFRALKTMMGVGPDSRIRDYLRVTMVDAASSVEDKLMNFYNNQLEGDGWLNPIVSYVQALRADGMANSLMRTGRLYVNENGLFDTKLREGEDPASLLKVFQAVKRLGNRIGSVDVASEAVSKVLISRRELQIHEENERLERLADRYDDEGNKKMAAAMREKIKNIFLTRGENGENRQMTDAELAERMAENQSNIDEYWDTTPEIREAFDLFTEYKNNLIQTAADTGYMSEERAELLMESLAYVPFYREQDGEYAQVSRGGAGLADVEVIRQLQGSNKEINVLDNMMQMSFLWTNAIMKNYASRGMVESLNEMGEVKKIYDDPNQIPRNEPSVTYRDKGVKKYAVLKDPLDVHAWQGMENVMIGGVLKPLSEASDWLRKGVTLMPDFIISQLEQDTFRAYALSGVKNPTKAAARVIPSYAQITKNLMKGELGDQRLSELGVIGMFDVSPVHTREQLEGPNVNDPEVGLRSKLGKAFAKGEKFSEASDLAQRKAIYDQTIAEGGSEVEAFWRASEIINFSRRGSGTMAHIARQAIPFFNAWLQGQSVLWKSLFNRGLSLEEKGKIMNRFVMNGLKIAALSVAYAAAMDEDEDWKNQPEYIRSRYFGIPLGDGRFIKIAMPPDLALLFKFIPENLAMETLGGRDTDPDQLGMEIRSAIGHALMSPNITPQLIKPTVEAVFNENFMTGSDLVSMGEAAMLPEEQIRPGTSQLARGIGQMMGISPIKVDHVLRGTFGIAGAHALLAADVALEAALDIERTEREMADLPVAKVFFTRQNPSGGKSEFYRLREDVRSHVATYNRFVKTGQFEKAQEFLEDEDKKRMLLMRSAVNKVDKFLRETNQRIRIIEASKTLTSEEKKERIDALRAQERRLNDQIERMRKASYE